MGTLARNQLTLPIPIRDEEKSQVTFLFQYNFQKCTGRKRLKSKVTIIQKTVSGFAEQIATF